MKCCFLDANVFFAAVKSHTGGSFFIIELAKQKKLKVVTVTHALAEAEKNIKEKIGEKALHAHYENLLAVQPKVQSILSIPSRLEETLSDVLPEKDIPIVAGAILSGSDILITLDRKHILRNGKLLSLQIPILIFTPGDFIQKYIKDIV